MSSSRYKLPEIDLNEIHDENHLAPVVKAILLNHDTFVLKNHANKNILDSLVDTLNDQEIPNRETEFDANFTGVLAVEDNILFEQYIFNTDDSLPFNREMANGTLKRLYTRLFKLGLFFAKICLESFVPDDEYKLDENNYSSVISRFFNNSPTGSQTLPTGEIFEYAPSPDYREFLPTGLLTVFPTTKGVKFKPPTFSADDNTWASFEDEDRLVLHTGSLLARLSGGRHTTSPLHISPDLNVMHLTVSLPLSTIIDNEGKRHVDILLRQQIQELPNAASIFYPRQTALLRLERQINLYKEMFSVCETVLSLYSISRSSAVKPELYSLLPQISNMMRRKTSQDDFLRMVSIWPQSYVIEANSKCELTVKLPNNSSSLAFTNKSRRLQYVEKADAWYNDMCRKEVIPNGIPLLKINKRRGSSGTFNRSSVDNMKTKARNSSNRPLYLSNSKEKYMYPEKKHDSQMNLLERLREKERRSAALLSQRQRQYQQFLTVKVNQVFDILQSLQWGNPYTVTYLSTLIVDSLEDTNNPIGYKEAEEILLKLQNLLNDEISVQTVEGGLKVYRWNTLNKEILASRIHQEEMDQSQE
ncbi:hypothetical protein HG535_0H01630 [Zygotorulaspora mrakii]|uniref:DNA replication factor Cdt1 C-terminal domain-containing protein n=1 Tax=Zygotorulaspora mrakii TaxID=42260 RepID=A0A7H9B8Z0_ZYGMR|nr:uncharacterized protein HG535_0H01630 [Zygotorulaspora mrakii]QLG74836.1 hypothetical protein HG535_0H01630 [Zygotorulaspora mrakii]